MNKRKIGEEYEERAVEYLQNHGYFILERNFRCPFGEIDIIAREGGCLVFLEVKYRKSGASGIPEEAVTREKQRKICRTADYYRMKRGCTMERPCRFDVAAILGETVTLYPNAFEYRK